MSDDFPRPTPYELVFRDADVPFEEERFPAIIAEAEARGVELEQPGPLVMLGSVGALMREMLLEQDAVDDAGAAWQAVPAEAIEQLGALIFHALRFWRAGGPVLHIDAELLRSLLSEAATYPQVRLAAPHDSGYLQLPRNLVWARPDADAQPEPVDGIFWAMGRRIEMLLALGVRVGRPGFTAVAMGADVEAGDAGRAGNREPAHGAGRANAVGRPGGADFENILPGGEMDRLLALTTEAEALKLVARVFHHAASHPLPGRQLTAAGD